jgi:hypothetical protein
MLLNRGPVVLATRGCLGKRGILNHSLDTLKGWGSLLRFSGRKKYDCDVQVAKVREGGGEGVLLKSDLWTLRSVQGG